MVKFALAGALPRRGAAGVKVGARRRPAPARREERAIRPLARRRHRRKWRSVMELLP